MLYFPQLLSGAAAQYPFSKLRISRTILARLPGGATSKLSDPGGARVRWRLNFQGLTDAERAKLQRFFTQVPAAISVQESHRPHGSAVGPSPFAQLRALARMRAVVVLPTPRAPENRKAWPMRPVESAFFSVRVTVDWPTTSSNVRGRHFRARTR